MAIYNFHAKRFTDVKLPPTWESWFTDYPEGYTILEALMGWIRYLNSMKDNLNDINNIVEHFLEWARDLLTDEARSVLEEWKNSGLLKQLLNEVVEEWFAEVKENHYVLRPSGDTTGVADRTNIQEALNEHRHVVLYRGEFYLSSPLEMATGMKLTGKGIASTNVHMVNDQPFIRSLTKSHDHIEVGHMRVVCDTPNKTATCIMLLDNGTGTIGPRYSWFHDLYIRDFNRGLHVQDLWCTRFDRLRVTGCNEGLRIDKSGNNISVTDSEFTHGQVGIIAEPSTGGTFLNGIYIKNCNFEQNKDTCLVARAVVNMSVHDMYVEAVNKILDINSCPVFSLNGATLNGIDGISGRPFMIQDTQYPSTFYKTPQYSIRDVNIQVKYDTDNYLLYATPGCGAPTIENVRIYNSGTGNVTLFSNLSRSKVREQAVVIPKTALDYNKHYVPIPPLYAGESVMTTRTVLKFTDSFTATAQGVLTVFGVLADGSTESLGIQYVNAGEIAAGTMRSYGSLTGLEKYTGLLFAPSSLAWYSSTQLNRVQIEVTYRIGDIVKQVV